MLYTSTPLNTARAAMVQDLYRLAFCRQLVESHPGAPAVVTPSPAQPHDDAIDAILEDYAAMLRRIDHDDDAELLLRFVSGMPTASPLLAS
jgi:hypothetical protein